MAACVTAGMWLWLWLLLLCVAGAPGQEPAPGGLVGCYQMAGNDSTTVQGATEVSTGGAGGASGSVDACVTACRERYYRYALLWAAQHCYCSSSYLAYADGQCDLPCAANASQTCGGAGSYGVFETGRRAPGPPAALTLLGATESSLNIQWAAPAVPNGPVTNYSIVAKPAETYASSGALPPEQRWLYPGGTSRIEVLDLHPGTGYNVSVAAVSGSRTGAYRSDLFWTKIGEPSPPPAEPEVLKASEGQITVRLAPSVNENGPVTAYQVVVIYDEGLVSFKPESLKDYHDSVNDGLSYYIAAELPASRLREGADNTFVVGDGRTYGSYFNPPLPPDKHVHVSLGVVSSLHGDTRRRYADTSHEQDGVVILNVGGGGGGGSGGGAGGGRSQLEVGLGAAVAVFGALLALSVAGFFVLRQRVRRRARRSPEQQELSLEGPIFEVEPAGARYGANNGYLPEEAGERVDHYRRLKDQVWDVPRNFLDIQSQLLGEGKYGSVVKGTVQQRGFPVPVAVHVIADGELAPLEKRAMLRDLGVLIRAGGGHDRDRDREGDGDPRHHVVQLVGICETPDTLYALVEHHPATLKDMLLESRGLQRGDAARRPCSLPESSLLDAALAVARAMEHLARLRITHSRLAARSVLMAHGVTAKLAGFGLAQLRPPGDAPDFTRWTACEVLRGGRPLPKSDVWAFGVLLWEVAALGGTPYADVPSAEVAGRVLRGLRPHQLAPLSDDLFQLMLQCWQVDPDERPSFGELARVLAGLATDGGQHLCFSAGAPFRYEPHMPQLESQ